MICLVIHRHTWHKSETLIDVVMDWLIACKIMVLHEIKHKVSIVLHWSLNLVIVWQRFYECQHIKPRINGALRRTIDLLDLFLLDFLLGILVDGRRILR